MTGETILLEPPEAYALWAPVYPPRAHNALMLAEERAMLSLLPADLRGCAVLDAGCGSGRYLAHAHRRGARTLLGIDVSAEMLSHARVLDSERPLVRASLEAIPIRDRWADVTVCGLTVGHVGNLEAVLAELKRVTKPGGSILCSDVHPIGDSLGWQRTFQAGEHRYAVKSIAHTIEEWNSAAYSLGLRLHSVLEPRLDSADIPSEAAFDSRALNVPVALVIALRREE